MSRSLGLGLSAMIVVAAGAARAADAPPLLPPAVIERPGTFVEEFRSGWYLRGDIGYRLNQVDGVEAKRTPYPFGGDYENNFSFGGGGGYKSGWFRFDVTGDWSPSTLYRASTSAAVNDYQTKIETFTALGNLYLDLGTWGGFTPYIGGGLGAALLRTTDYVGISYPIANYEKASRWNFAWALTGGFSFNLAPNLLLDASYRWLDLGDATTTLSNANQLTIKDITAHEFRVGLRYNID
ncbi:MAG: porin family protein [Pseudorhodoplanes sp.]|nr:MAG: porin family protein [Pseudorhodoplanes sp.]